MARQKDRKQASKEAIDLYWKVEAKKNNHELCSIIGDASFEAILDGKGCHCYACGKPSNNLQRCHIVPHSLGGGGEPENMFLMCVQCHRDNPDTIYKDLFFNYVKNRTYYVATGWMNLYDDLNKFIKESSKEDVAAYEKWYEKAIKDDGYVLDTCVNAHKNGMVVEGAFSRSTRIGVLWKGMVEAGNNIK